MSEALIQSLGLEKVESLGGYCKRVYVSSDHVEAKRQCASMVLYYLASDDFCAWHRLDSDEILHFYQGSDLIVHQLNDAGELTCVRLGGTDSAEDAVPFTVVPRGTWFSQEIGCENAYALIGAVSVPGYSEASVEIGDVKALSAQFPDHQAIIQRLGR